MIGAIPTFNPNSDYYRLSDSGKHLVINGSNLHLPIQKCWLD